MAEDRTDGAWEHASRMRADDPVRDKGEPEARDEGLATHAYEKRYGAKEDAAQASPWKRVEIPSERAAKHGPKHGGAQQESSLAKARGWKVALGVCAFLLVAVIGVGGAILSSSSDATDAPVIEASELITTVDSTKLPEIDDAELTYNPIDFTALYRQNADIYAWLYVPGTQVNMPVLQNATADNYYLYRNVDKEEDETGAIYSQTMNSKDFTDPVTVLYGHTFQPDDARADAAFGTLHEFEDAAFFDGHPFFYIYTPQKMYTYKIVSAGETNSDHILNTHDFADREVLQAYLDAMQQPTGDHFFSSGMERLEAGQAYLVQLSTCTRPSVPEKRYLVTGVMVGEKNLQPSW